MHISNRFVIVCNIQVVIRMLKSFYRNFQSPRSLQHLPPPAPANFGPQFPAPANVEIILL